MQITDHLVCKTPHCMKFCESVLEIVHWTVQRLLVTLRFQLIFIKIKYLPTLCTSMVQELNISPHFTRVQITLMANST